MGRRSRCVASARTSSDTPRASLPITRATSPPGRPLKKGSPSSCEDTTAQPCPASPRSAPAMSTRSTGTRKAAPIEARSTLGENGSGQLMPISSASKAAASQVRHIVPTLPGSCTPSSAATSSARPRARARATTASSSGCAGGSTAATMPCGVTVSHRLSSTCGAALSAPLPANSALTRVSSYSTSRTLRPLARASASIFSPSISIRPSRRRALGSRSARSAFTRGFWVLVISGIGKLLFAL